MCVGMFMAVLDVQVVASFAHRDPDRASYSAGPAGLDSNRLSDGRSGGDSFDRYPHPRAVAAHPVRRRHVGLCHRQLGMRPVTRLRCPDRRAGGAGIFRRHADSFRLHRRLCSDPPASSYSRHHHGGRRGVVRPHLGAAVGRLAYRDAILALDFPDQHPARPDRGVDRADVPQKRKAEHRGSQAPRRPHALAVRDLPGRPAIGC